MPGVGGLRCELWPGQAHVDERRGVKGSRKRWWAGHHRLSDFQVLGVDGGQVAIVLSDTGGVARLWARVRLLVGLLYVGRRDVRVDLCGRQVLVAEEFLDDPQVGTAIEKVRRKAVA